MKRFFAILGCSIAMMGCDQTVKEISVLESVEEAAPMEPAETEVWSPKPKTVSVDETTGIPSDAIVLFDGIHFDEWISSKDSTAVQWILNKDKSMTVKDISVRFNCILNGVLILRKEQMDKIEAIAVFFFKTDMRYRF